MFNPFRSLRLRLITMYVVIFGVVQIALSAAVVLLGEQHLREYFDGELLQRSESLAAKVQKSRRQLFAPGLADVMKDETRTVFFRDVFVQLRDAQGTPLQRSVNLAQYQLPYDATMQVGEVATQTRLDTLSGQEVESLVGPGERLRMVTRVVPSETEGGIIVQVAAGLQQVDATARQWRLLVMRAVGGGLAAAAIVSWFVTGRAVRKIKDVSEFVQQVQPGKLNARLAHVRGGDEIGQMVQHVNQMLQRLETGFAGQDRFIHDASHELKTPLSTILSEAQVLKMMNPTPEQCQRFIDSVEQEARHLAGLVDSLLVLARVDRDKPALAREVASVNDVVEHAVGECKILAAQHGVSVNLQLCVPDETLGELTFNGDRGLVGSMISNLIRNAVRFSPAQGVVTVQVSRRETQASIEVRDQGPGVPPDQLARIFERFAQAEPTAPRRGTGLGLSIARTIARLHGGEISVTNLKGGGCVFSVTLPAYIEPQ